MPMRTTYVRNTHAHAWCEITTVARMIGRPTDGSAPLMRCPNGARVRCDATVGPHLRAALDASAFCGTAIVSFDQRADRPVRWLKNDGRSGRPCGRCWKRVRPLRSWPTVLGRVGWCGWPAGAVLAAACCGRRTLGCGRGRAAAEGWIPCAARRTLAAQDGGAIAASRDGAVLAELQRLRYGPRPTGRTAVVFAGPPGGATNGSTLGCDRKVARLRPASVRRLPGRIGRSPNCARSDWRHGRPRDGQLARRFPRCSRCGFSNQASHCCATGAHSVRRRSSPWVSLQCDRMAIRILDWAKQTNHAY